MTPLFFFSILIIYSHYPSEAATFAHLSANLLILSQKNCASLAAKNVSNYFLISSVEAFQTGYSVSFETNGN